MSINFSIVIPNYNGAKFIQDCLQSINVAIKHCPTAKFEIIIVDNGSTDNSLKLLKKHTVIKNKINYGFATAVNQGIKKSKYKYVCLLNNDLKLDKLWFKHISKAIDKFPIATTFCGTVLNYNGAKIESQGFKYYMSGKCENINNGLPFLEIDNLKFGISPIWGSSAAAVVYRKSIIQKIGLFDESFFAYIEDVDLSYRLAKSQQLAILNPMALTYHLGGRTSSTMGNLRAKYTLINWFKLILKNYAFTEILFNLPSIMIERLRNLSYFIRSSFIITKNI